MTSRHLYIDVHILQTVPPANLNRDDAGSPKQAIFGGVRRARVSSQAWKRATRKYFAESTPIASRATRTARISTLLTQRLLDSGGLDRDQSERVAAILLDPLKITPGKKDDTAYLLFFGRSQIERVVEQVVAKVGAGAAELGDSELAEALADISVQNDLMKGHPLDVALFGRMVADLPAINVDAAVQVAHALSTHRVEIEFDYFTAVDDEKDRSAGDDAGAAMIGTVEFNSATLYRYATVGVHQLVDNLGGAHPEVADAVRRFVEGFVRSMPTGHQTTFAHRTLPDAVVVIARDDQPVNLVSAFEQPVRPPAGGGYAAVSLKALATEYERVCNSWGGEPRLVVSTYSLTGQEDVAGSFGQPLPFDRLLDATSKVVEEHLAGIAS
jgi:CRISPR system Cascade subunit CasC